MEEIYVNVEEIKPVHQTSATNNRGSISSKKRLHLGVLISLGLLNVFLVAGLVVFGVHSRGLAADLSTIRDNLTERLQTCNDKLSSMTEDRDLLKANLTELDKHLIELQSSSKQKKTCPSEWRTVSSSCYFVSTKSASWEEARKDCRDKEADLMVVNDGEEQKFIASIKTDVWIGLTDNVTEGTWKWVDGTPLNQTYWETNQPDNGGGLAKWGKEDCVHVTIYEQLWNDISCKSSRQWICEKTLMINK